MGKRVFIIGGTYFAGRVFAMLAAKQGHELTFLNRGRYSMKGLSEDVREYRADRTRSESLKACTLTGDFDAVVDFCAYEPGDIRNIFECLSIRTKQYIFMSTADVYERKPGSRTESSKRVESSAGDPVSMYVYKKKLLEDELAAAAEAYRFSCTILRPAFIYGPYNYAPRESFYIRSLLRKEPIYHPEDASGRFQLVYVRDVAEAILACIGKEEDRSRVYNLSAPEVLDYEAFLALMEKASGIKAETVVPVTCAEAEANRLPLPFPLTEEESELFDGSRACRELGITYTDLESGMRKTFEAFRPVFFRQDGTAGA